MVQGSKSGVNLQITANLGSSAFLNCAFLSNNLWWKANKSPFWLRMSGVISIIPLWGIHDPAQLAFETVFMTAASKNVFVGVYGAILITYLIELKTLEPVHTQLTTIWFQCAPNLIAGRSWCNQLKHYWCLLSNRTWEKQFWPHLSPDPDHKAALNIWGPSHFELS